MNWLQVNKLIRRALMEDIGHGDVTTELTPGADRQVTGRFLAKQDGVLCGAEVAACCFTMLDPACRCVFRVVDGAAVAQGDELGTVTGPGTAILTAERVALNFLQRLSGIASQARSLSERASAQGIRVVETRKTTPGLRILEKYAVQAGGGYNHRMDLDHAVMLKDNHFALAGGDPAKVVSAVKSRVPHTMKVVAEAGDPSMVEPLVSAGTDVVLLDNFTPEQVRAAVAEVAGRCLIELSGGINEGNLDGYLIDGVDVISIGALTHSYESLDISLDVVPE